MTNNGTLGALNETLFEQMKKLTSMDLKDEALKDEIERSKAVSCLARDVIANGRLILDATRQQSLGRDADEAHADSRSLLGGK